MTTMRTLGNDMKGMILARITTTMRTMKMRTRTPPVRTSTLLRRAR